MKCKISGLPIREPGTSNCAKRTFSKHTLTVSVLKQPQARTDISLINTSRLDTHSALPLVAMGTHPPLHHL